MCLDYWHEWLRPHNQWVEHHQLLRCDSSLQFIGQLFTSPWQCKCAARQHRCAQMCLDYWHEWLYPHTQWVKRIRVPSIVMRFFSSVHWSTNIWTFTLTVRQTAELRWLTRQATYLFSKVVQFEKSRASFYLGLDQSRWSYLKWSHYIIITAIRSTVKANDYV